MCTTAHNAAAAQPGRARPMAKIVAAVTVAVIVILVIGGSLAAEFILLAFFLLLVGFFLASGEPAEKGERFIFIALPWELLKFKISLRQAQGDSLVFWTKVFTAIWSGQLSPMKEWTSIL